MTGITNGQVTQWCKWQCSETAQYNPDAERISTWFQAVPTYLLGPPSLNTITACTLFHSPLPFTSILVDSANMGLQPDAHATLLECDLSGCPENVRTLSKTLSSPSFPLSTSPPPLSLSLLPQSTHGPDGLQHGQHL